MKPSEATLRSLLPHPPRAWGGSPRGGKRALLLAAALLAGCAAGERSGAASAGAGEGPAIVAEEAPAPVPAPRRAAPALGPAGVFGPYLAGRLAANESDAGAAAEALLTALAADPDEAEILTRAFNAAVMDGRPEAVRLARRLPESQLAALLLAGADAQAGRWERAEARIRGLPRQGSAQILQPLLLAWTQAGRGNADTALATLKPFSEGGQLRGVAALHGAMIADLANRPREAERLVRIAVAETPEPNLRLATIAAGILARAGREADGARLFDAMSLGSDDIALTAGPAARRAALSGRAVASATEGMAEAQVALGAALRGQGAPELALILARLSLRLRPGFAPAQILAAESMADERHVAAALAVLEGVPEGDPMAPLAALRRAGLLGRLDRGEEAAALLRRLAEAYPAAPQPAIAMGDLLRREGRPAEAATAYGRAIARLPQPGAADWPLFHARAVARERAGNWAGAEADLRQALALSPEEPVLLNHLAYAWVERGERLDEARGMLERAAAARPQDGHIADSLGWALFRLGDLRGAIDWLEKAAELESRNAVINDHLGDAYWAAGRQAEARFQWRRALGLDPEPGETGRIEAKMRDGLPSTTAMR
ncbi:tetratricopeptide repeat protein [Muricoccus pecuniae]|uniref:Tetratricopeptide (TPR) repeat protein n=1 Tax=Muricoccus pecuniae TaxID=693023 RepID=A0A840Y8P4_9PROT|nr:tetratricopeptide repeat protein [Roseomonas pecuniae]MBB5696300.1 tetratricopeptide (TPR) repeat protein [Roseomonas pecuniae]